MSVPELPSDPNVCVQSYGSEFRAANANWARRMNQTFPQYFSDPKVKQAPKILWIRCSDSRVQDSDLLATLPGQVFVHRNIANQVHADDDNVLSVIAYAVGALKVQHIVIVGHNHCGGVISALESRGRTSGDKPEHQYIIKDSLYDDVQSELDQLPAYTEESKGPGDVLMRWLLCLTRHLRGLPQFCPPNPEEELKTAVAANVRLQVDDFKGTRLLHEFVKKTAERGRRIWVHGWVYDFRHGFIEDLNITEEIVGERGPK